MNAIRRFLADENGATAIEYGLIAALIVLAAVGSFPTMSAWVNEMIMATAEAMPS